MINGLNLSSENQDFILGLIFNSLWPQKSTKKCTEEAKISVKLKLAMLWTSFMFLYIYVDYFALYMPSKIEYILKGRVFVFGITQDFLLTTLSSVTIPALMFFLSVSLPAKVNRWANIIIVTMYIPFTFLIWQEKLGCTWCWVGCCCRSRSPLSNYPLCVEMATYWNKPIVLKHCSWTCKFCIRKYN